MSDYLSFDRAVGNRFFFIGSRAKSIKNKNLKDDSKPGWMGKDLLSDLIFSRMMMGQGE